MATLAELEKQLAELKQQHQLVNEQLEWLRMVVRMVGIDGPWVTPQVAGKLLGRSRERVMADINLAETLRTNNRQQTDFIYGTHYRNDQTHDSGQPTWKVHLLKYAEYTTIPPDQIKVA